MKIHILTITVAAVLTAGCNRQPRVIVEVAPPAPTPLPVARTVTFETRALGREIDTFEQTPSTVHRARVQKAFAEIDGEIAELVEHVAKKTGDARAEAARKLADLRAYREGEQVRFARLEVQKPFRAEEPGAPTRGDGTAEKIGEKIDRTANKIEDKIRDAADVVRDKTR